MIYICRIAVGIKHFAECINGIIVGIDGIAVGGIDAVDGVDIIFTDGLVVIAHQHRRSAVGDAEDDLVGVSQRVYVRYEAEHTLCELRTCAFGGTDRYRIEINRISGTVDLEAYLTRLLNGQDDG